MKPAAQLRREQEDRASLHEHSAMEAIAEKMEQAIETNVSYIYAHPPSHLMGKIQKQLEAFGYVAEIHHDPRDGSYMIVRW